MPKVDPVPQVVPNMLAMDKVVPTVPTVPTEAEVKGVKRQWWVLPCCRPMASREVWVVRALVEAEGVAPMAARTQLEVVGVVVVVADKQAHLKIMAVVVVVLLLVSLLWIQSHVWKY